MEFEVEVYLVMELGAIASDLDNKLNGRLHRRIVPSPNRDPSPSSCPVSLLKSGDRKDGVSALHQTTKRMAYFFAFSLW